MIVEIKDVEASPFADATQHLKNVGATGLSVFKDRRQNEGPWLVAFIIVDRRRHVRWTGDRWRGLTLFDQAVDMADQLLRFDPAASIPDLLAAPGEVADVDQSNQDGRTPGGSSD